MTTSTQTTRTRLLGDAAIRLYFVCVAVGLVLVGELLGTGHWALSALLAALVVASPYAIAVASLLRSGR